MHPASTSRQVASWIGDLVGAKSAFLRFRLRRKLQPLPCSSSPHATRFAGLPWGSHFRAAGVFHQQVHLPGKVPTANAVHIAEVGPIHPNQQVVLLVVAVLELAGGVALTGNEEVSE